MWHLVCTARVQLCRCIYCKVNMLAPSMVYILYQHLCHAWIWWIVSKKCATIGILGLSHMQHNISTLWAGLTQPRIWLPLLLEENGDVWWCGHSLDKKGTGSSFQNKTDGLCAFIQSCRACNGSYLKYVERWPLGIDNLILETPRLTLLF